MSTLADLAVGEKVKFGSLYGAPIVWKVIDQNHYGTGQTTLLTEGIVKLACFDAKESGNSDSNRQSYGNNNYSVSNLRQWLCSDAAAGKWYSAQHSADAAPTNSNVWSNYNEYDGQAGFLNAFTSDEKAAIVATDLTHECASQDGSSPKAIKGQKVFLLSCTEVGLSGGATCGKKFSCFNSDSDRVAKPTATCVSNSEYKDNVSSNSGWYWFLRDAYSSSSYNVRYVRSDGTLYSGGYGGAYYGDGGVRPALNLKSQILVSDTKDSDGCRTLVYNNPPLAPASIDVPAGFVYQSGGLAVSWAAASDPDGDSIGYELQRKEGSGSWAQAYKGTATSYTDTGVSNGTTTVTYRVRAYDAKGGTSDWRNGGSCAVVYNQPPTAPTGLTCPETFKWSEGSGIELAWTAAADPDGDSVSYEVQRSSGGGEYKTVGTPAATAFTDSEVPYMSEQVRYRVRAKDPAGSTSAWLEGSDVAVESPQIVMTVSNFRAFLKSCIGDGLVWDGSKLSVTGKGE